MAETVTESDVFLKPEKQNPEYPLNWEEKMMQMIRRTIRLPHDGRHRMILTQMGFKIPQPHLIEDHLKRLMSPFRQESIHVIGIYNPQEYKDVSSSWQDVTEVHLFSTITFTLVPVSETYPKSVLLLDPNGSLRVTFRYQNEQLRRIEEVLKLIRQLRFS